MPINRIIGDREDQIYIIKILDDLVSPDLERLTQQFQHIFQNRHIEGILLDCSNTRNILEETSQFLQRLLETLQWGEQAFVIYQPHPIDSPSFNDFSRYYTHCDRLENAIFCITHYAQISQDASVSLSSEAEEDKESEESEAVEGEDANMEELLRDIEPPAHESLEALLDDSSEEETEEDTSLDELLETPSVSVEGRLPKVSPATDQDFEQQPSASADLDSQALLLEEEEEEGDDELTLELPEEAELAGSNDLDLLEEDEDTAAEALELEDNDEVDAPIDADIDGSGNIYAPDEVLLLEEDDDEEIEASMSISEKDPLGDRDDLMEQYEEAEFIDHDLKAQADEDEDKAAPSLELPSADALEEGLEADHDFAENLDALEESDPDEYPDDNFDAPDDAPELLSAGLNSNDDDFEEPEHSGTTVAHFLDEGQDDDDDFFSLGDAINQNHAISPEHDELNVSLLETEDSHKNYLLWIWGAILLLLPLLAYQSWKVSVFELTKRGEDQWTQRLTWNGKWLPGTGYQGANLFMFSLASENTKLLSTLIHYPFDWSEVDHEGRNTLMYVAYYGKHKIIAPLLAKDININQVDHQHRTALMWAAQQGHYETVRTLLEEKADPELKDQDGHSALDLAHYANHSDVIKLLRLAQEGILFSESTWFDAVEHNNLALLKTLLAEGIELQTINEYGQTALMVAANHGHHDLVQWLLEQGAEVNHVSHLGETALSLSSFKGYTQLAHTLLAKGADPNLGEVNALMWASFGGYMSLVKAYVDAGANINLQNKQGWTPLMFSVKKSNLPVAEFLLRQGADPNLVEEFGEAALMIAARMNHDEMVRILVEHGANVFLKNTRSQTAKDIAVERGFLQLAKQL